MGKKKESSRQKLNRVQKLLEEILLEGDLNDNFNQLEEALRHVEDVKYFNDRRYFPDQE